MRKLYLLFIALFLSSANYAQDSIMPILQETFQSYELVSDLEFIKNKAIYKKYNYNGLLYAGKERFTQLYDSIERVINEQDKMSRIDFYFLTTPLIHLLQDDVSIYSLLGEYAHNPKNDEYLPFAEKTVIPLAVSVFHDSVFIVGEKSGLHKSQLISINDIPANKVVADICKYTSFRKDRYYRKYKYASVGLYNNSVILNLLYGFHDEVELKYSPFESDDILTKKVELLPIGDSAFYNSIKRRTDSKPWHSLTFENNYAVLKIMSMPRGELKLDELDNIFKQIDEHGSTSMIIDISDCSWSYDNFWIVVLNYLYEGELSLYEHQKKPLDLSKFSKKRINNATYILGKYADINKEFLFKGKIYLITGSSTSSSAVRFADILKYNKISDKIFGGETLTKTTQYDFYNSYYLPATGIALGLSNTLFYALDKNLDTHGLIPDVEVVPANTIEFLDNTDNKLIIERVIKLIDTEHENTTHR